MRPLQLWQKYSREEVHDIFSPETPFTPGGGTWGMQGIVKVPERPGSYVFFVTFGTTQGDHDFDESITDDGVLTWQSQPKQRLVDPTILDLVGHDDRLSSLHLFLRTRRREPYTYCGPLGYLAHDEEREQPVHFQWQLLDWPAPVATVEEMGLALVATTNAGTATSAPPPATPAVAVPTFVLDEEPPPPSSKPGAARTKTFKAVKIARHPDQDARNKKLGLEGEELVLEAERRRLIAAGRSDLAVKVSHVSVIEGDGAGYDIKSYKSDGDVQHLEVKTTRNGKSSAFFVSPNEVAFSEAHPESYVLVRVFAYDPKTKSGNSYRSPGPLLGAFSLTATEFRASP